MADETITPNSESMVERVARAMHDLDRRPHRAWHQASEETKLLYLDRAHAAITALREPTDSMCLVGHWNSPTRDIWRAMIDAALKE